MSCSIVGSSYSIRTFTQPGLMVALLILFAFMSACGGGGGSDPGPGTGSGLPPLDSSKLNVLFVGNSLTYSNDLPGILAAFFEAANVGEFFIDDVSIGGTALVDHWSAGRARPEIERGGWDFVVMQQGPSATEGRPLLLEYAEIFNTAITATGAKSAMYMVWPAKVRFFDFDGVFDSYHTAAVNIGGYFFPGGEAWRVAWETEPDLQFYGGDDFHPSPMGSYLVALVMFEQITGMSPVGLPSVVSTSNGVISIPPERAEMLQNVAVETNSRHALQKKKK